MIFTYIVMLLTTIAFGCFSPSIMISESSMVAHLLTHICLTGAVLSTMFNCNSIVFQCFFNSLCSILISSTHGKNIHQDAHANLLTNALLSVGLSLSYLYSSKSFSLISKALSPGLSYRASTDLIFLTCACFAVLLFQVFYAKKFFAYVIHPELASYYSHKNSRLIWVLFNISMSIVMTISRYIVGPLLCLPILVGPGAIAFQWKGECSGVITLSTFIAVLAVGIAEALSAYTYISITSGINFVLLAMYYTHPVYTTIRRKLIS